MFLLLASSTSWHSKCECITNDFIAAVSWDTLHFNEYISISVSYLWEEWWQKWRQSYSEPGRSFLLPLVEPDNLPARWRGRGSLQAKTGDGWIKKAASSAAARLQQETVLLPVLMTSLMAVATWPLSRELSSLTSSIKQLHSTSREKASRIRPMVKSDREESTKRCLPEQETHIRHDEGLMKTTRSEWERRKKEKRRRKRNPITIWYVVCLTFSADWLIDWLIKWNLVIGKDIRKGKWMRGEFKILSHFHLKNLKSERF